VRARFRVRVCVRVALARRDTWSRGRRPVRCPVSRLPPDLTGANPSRRTDRPTFRLHARITLSVCASVCVFFYISPDDRCIACNRIRGRRRHATVSADDTGLLHPRAARVVGGQQDRGGGDGRQRQDSPSHDEPSLSVSVE